MHEAVGLRRRAGQPGLEGPSNGELGPSFFARTQCDTMAHLAPRSHTIQTVIQDVGAIRAKST